MHSYKLTNTDKADLSYFLRHTVGHLAYSFELMITIPMMLIITSNVQW